MKTLTKTSLLSVFFLLFFADLPAQTEKAKFRSEDGAFAVQFPRRPFPQNTEREMEAEDGTKGTTTIHLFTAPVPSKKIIYLARYNDYPSGFVVDDRERVFDTMLEELETVWNTPVVRQRALEHAGLQGREVHFVVEGNPVVLQVFLRGNRTYLLMVQLKDVTQFPLARAFFDSFEILPLQHSKPSSVKLADSDVQVAIPAEPVVYFFEDSELEFPAVVERDYYSLDERSGLIYLLVEQEWSPYYELENVDSFFADMFRSIQEDSTLLHFQDTTHWGQRAWTAEYFSPLSGLWSQHLSFFMGNALFELAVFKPDAGYTEQAWAYFNSFELLREFDPGFLASDKTPLIFQELVSTDRATSRRAKAALGYHELTTADLPLVYEVLETPMPHDSSSWQTVHEYLLPTFDTLQDAATVPFLDRLFEQKRDVPSFQALILQSLVALKNRAGVDVFFEKIPRLTADTTEVQDYSPVLYPLFDTLELAVNYVPQLVELRTDRRFAYGAYSLLRSISQTDSIEHAILNRYTDQFLTDVWDISTRHHLIEPQDSLPVFEEYGDLTNLLMMLGNLETTPNLSSELARLQTLQDPYLLETVATALMKHGQPIDDATFEWLVQSSPDWYDLLVSFEKKERLDAIPAAFLTAESVAGAYAANTLRKEDEYLTDVQVLEERPFTYEGTELRLFLFRFKYLGEEAQHLGIVSQPTGDGYSLHPQVFDVSFAEFSEERKEEILERMLGSGGSREAKFKFKAQTQTQNGQIATCANLAVLSLSLRLQKINSRGTAHC